MFRHLKFRLGGHDDYPDQWAAVLGQNVYLVPEEAKPKPRTATQLWACVVSDDPFLVEGNGTSFFEARPRFLLPEGTLKLAFRRVSNKKTAGLQWQTEIIDPQRGTKLVLVHDEAARFQPLMKGVEYECRIVRTLFISDDRRFVLLLVQLLAGQGVERLPSRPLTAVG